MLIKHTHAQTHREGLQPEGVPQQLLKVGGPAAHAADHVDATLAAGGGGRSASAAARRGRVATGRHGSSGGAAVDDVRDGDVVLEEKHDNCISLTPILIWGTIHILTSAPEADVVREVAWILSPCISQWLNADKGGGGGLKGPSILHMSYVDGPFPDLIESQGSID